MQINTGYYLTANYTNFKLYSQSLVYYYVTSRQVQGGKNNDEECVFVISLSLTSFIILLRVRSHLQIF